MIYLIINEFLCFNYDQIKTIAVNVTAQIGYNWTCLAKTNLKTMKWIIHSKCVCL